MKRPEIDTSPDAIARRLEEVRSLYRLTMSLGRARVIGAQESEGDGEARGESGDRSVTR
jgi:hypothetical protein